MIKAIFAEGRGNYGARRIAEKLALREIFVSRRRVRNLMEIARLVCKTKRKFKATTDSQHNKHISPNLLARQFKVMQPNHYWVGYITYIPTNEGWLYLAVVIDLFSRQVVGWSMDSRIQTKLVNDAMLMQSGSANQRVDSFGTLIVAASMNLILTAKYWQNTKLSRA